jgi:serine protease DegQ
VVRRFVPVLAFVVLLAGCSGDDDDSASSTTPLSPVTVTETVGGTGTGTSSAGGTSSFDRIPELVDSVEPSVVSVTTNVGEGSGVIWNDDGIVVTNNHVVENASGIEVVLASGAHLPATVEATTHDFDLAVLRVGRKGLPPARFAKTVPDVGQLAVAIGNPLGFEQSVTAGIVSAVHRSIPSGGQTRALVDLIQTDAAISPGNSGGALVGADGRVMGINVAYLPPQSTGAVALGFAIPAPTVTDIVGQLLRTGKVEQSYLGIQNPASVTPDVAQQFDLSTDQGVVFEGIEEGGPADRAGLRPGDVILAIEGKSTETVEDLFRELRRLRPGRRVSLRIVRGKQRRTIDVTLGERPTQ